MHARRAVPLLCLAFVAALGLAAPVGATTPATAVEHTGLPNRILTPGALNHDVTQATIHQTICVSGWTATIRPSSTYTTNLKKSQLVMYGFTDHALNHYEEDHLISLELGGSPSNARNLWPEPHDIKLANGTQVGSYTKDAFENYLKREVCAGRMSLATAQTRIARNWVYYWRLWKASSPAPSTPVAAPTPTPKPTATPAAAMDPIAAAKAAGATAICNDGTYSYSAHRSGTCSQHGGVYWWTGNLGPAGPG